MKMPRTRAEPTKSRVQSARAALCLLGWLDPGEIQIELWKQACTEKRVVGGNWVNYGPTSFRARSKLVPFRVVFHVGE